MAPKRTAKVVKTTKKVLEETVEILTVPGDSQNSVDVVPPAGSSRVVEFDVHVDETQVPISDEPTQEVEPADRDCQDKDGKEAEPRTPANVEKPASEKGGDEREEQDNQAKPRTPRKVEQAPRREAAEKGTVDGEQRPAAGGRQRRKRTKRYSGPGGGVGEMDGLGRGYKRYVFQVLKQVHPDLGISSRAMAVVDGMLGDMFERLAGEASRLSAYVGKTTLSSREIQGAVRLVLPGDLGKHAITQGTTAVSTYVAAAAADAE